VACAHLLRTHQVRLDDHEGADRRGLRPLHIRLDDIIGEGVDS